VGRKKYPCATYIHPVHDVFMSLGRMNMSLLHMFIMFMMWTKWTAWTKWTD
jgi:hypothetical protein